MLTLIRSSLSSASKPNAGSLIGSLQASLSSRGGRERRGARRSEEGSKATNRFDVSSSSSSSSSGGLGRRGGRHRPDYLAGGAFWAAVRRNNPEEAIEALGKLEAPKGYEVAAVVRGLGRAGRVKGAFSLVNNLKKTGFEPSLPVFHALLESLVVAPTVNNSGGRDMKSSATPVSNMIEKAWAVHEDMARWGIQPDRVAFNWLLRAALTTQPGEVGVKARSKISGLALTKEAALEARKSSMYGEALKVFSAMMTAGVAPNLETFRISVMGAGVLGRDLRLAFDLFSLAQSDKEVTKVPLPPSRGSSGEGGAAESSASRRGGSDGNGGKSRDDVVTTERTETIWNDTGVLVRMSELFLRAEPKWSSLDNDRWEQKRSISTAHVRARNELVVEGGNADTRLWNALLSACRICGRPGVMDEVYKTMIRRVKVAPSHETYRIVAPTAGWRERQGMAAVYLYHYLTRAPSSEGLPLRGVVLSLLRAATSHPGHVARELASFGTYAPERTQELIATLRAAIPAHVARMEPSPPPSKPKTPSGKSFPLKLVS